MKRLLTVALAVAATTAMLAAIAPAHTKKYGGSLSIAQTATGFGGAINGKAACEKNRRVRVTQSSNRLAKGPGGGPGGGKPPEPVGTATTDNSGNWSVTDSSNIPAGSTVTATMTAKVLRRNSNHLHKCKPRRASLTT